MPIADYEKRLAYYRDYWKTRPEQYKIHKINCSRNRRLKPFISVLREAYKKKENIPIRCLQGSGEEEVFINALDLIALIPTFRNDAIPLKVWFNEEWLVVISNPFEVS